MKKFYLLFAFVIMAVTDIAAQSDFDYYIDFIQSNEKIYFKYVDGKYEAEVGKINSDFKIYSSKYTSGASGQDKYIFGGADGQGGITPNSEKQLSNPGSNLSIEGGGILYNATLIFDPVAMTLKIEGGSSIPTKPGLELNIVSTVGTSPETGELTFSLEYFGPGTAPIPTEYIVTAYYTDYHGNNARQELTLSDGTISTYYTSGIMRGTFYFTDLKPAAVNYVALKAVADVSSAEEISATGIAPVNTPALPILIGQIQGHEWQPDYGISGIQFTEIPDGKTYYYEVNLAGNGEFSFVTKLGTTSTDWDTVNRNIRYAPPTSRVAAPEKTWMPYSTFASGGTSNAWYPENFTPGAYIVEFDYTTQSIAVVKGNIPTGVADVTIDDSPRAVNVYTISGTMLRHNISPADAVTGLPAGIYIVGNKKIAVY